MKPQPRFFFGWVPGVLPGQPVLGCRSKVPPLTWYVCVLIGVLFLSGCAGTLASRSQRLDLGMTKAHVVKILGKKFTVVAAREEFDGRKTEVLRFEDPKSGEMFVYFRDGRMVQWGDVRALENMPQ